MYYEIVIILKASILPNYEKYNTENPLISRVNPATFLHYSLLKLKVYKQ